MRLNDKKNNIVKEYVRRKVDLLLEYDDPDTGGGAGYWSMGTQKNQEFILTLFGIRPLQNIARVALGGLEAIITRTFGELWVIAERLYYTLAPWEWARSREEINQIVNQTRAGIADRISRVNAGYADVMRNNSEILGRMSGDINAAMFLANPASVISNFAASETADGAYNLYHRIRYGGPPPDAPGGSSTSAHSATGGTDAALNAEKSGLMSRASSVDASRGGGTSTAESVAREILGSHASEEDVASLVSSARGATTGGLTEAGGAVADDSPSTKTGSTTPRPATSTSSLPAPARAPNVSDPALEPLIAQARQLNQRYVAFLKSPEARAGIMNNPGVKEGQAALVDIVVDSYRNQIKDISFESMRSEHPEEFENAEEEARKAQEENSGNEENSEEESDSSDRTEEENVGPLFDTEEKRNTFVTYVKQQLSALPIAQLQALAQQTPELRNVVNTGIAEIQRLASAR